MKRTRMRLFLATITLVLFCMLPSSAFADEVDNTLNAVTNVQNTNEHTCVANEWYNSDTEGHWKTCSTCGNTVGTKEAHNYSDGRCTVCNAVNPNHTCVPADWYGQDENGHYQMCSICFTKIGETQAHEYANGRCTVCNAVDPSHTCVAGDLYGQDESGHYRLCSICYNKVGATEAHKYSDGRCTVCNAVDPNHTCVAGDSYGQDESGHYRLCSICYNKVGETEAHKYEHECCTVCGEASPSHVHNYRWLSGESSQFCVICNENPAEKTETEHTHNYENHKCETCGLLDPDLTPTSIVVGNNGNKQMTLTLKFSDGTSMNLTILSMIDRAGDDGVVMGDIYTKEGVILPGYALMWNDNNGNKQYTIANTNPWGEKEVVVGNYGADASWYEIQKIAQKKGVVMDSCSYGNGVWTVTGTAYDACEATMTLDSDLNVKTCDFIPCTHTKKTEYPAVAATCDKDGNELYYVCNTCGKILNKDGEVIDSVPVLEAGHIYVDGRCTVCAAVDPTHAHKYVDGYCTVCYAVEPNHTHNYTDYKCTICGAVDPTHECVAGDSSYAYYDNGHWTICKYCGKRLGTTEAHNYANYKCSVCGYTDPTHPHNYVNDQCTVCNAYRHTCVADDYYDYDKDGHYKKCCTCGNIVGTKEDHHYVNGECTVCYATICDYNNPNDPAHNYVNGVCTVCYAVDPNHTCVESDLYGQAENGHYKKCRICNGRLGAIEAHAYVHACCVCGKASPDHVHNYVWYSDEEGKASQYCIICTGTDECTEKKEGTTHTHKYVNRKCETCGLLDPSLTLNTIVVGSNNNKQMTLTLKFSDGTSMNLTILSMIERAGDDGGTLGDIYTKEGVTLNGYWLLWKDNNGNKEYTIAYNPLGEEGSVIGNYVADASWYEIQTIAQKKGIVMDSCSYANGVWTATGTAYDGCEATMTLDSDLNVKTCNFIPCTHAKKTTYPAVAATCDKDGNELYYVCNTCGKILDKDGEVIESVPVLEAGHIYVDGYCTICHEIDPNHTCVEGDEYGYDETGHWKVCKICRKQMGTAVAHNYEGGICTVCGSSQPTHEHNYVDYKCTVCGAVNPNHTCVVGGTVYTEDGHWKTCSICGEKFGVPEAHNYENYLCTICGRADPNHAHNYSDGRCTVCNAIDPAHTHNYSDGRCTVCNCDKHECTANVWYDHDKNSHYKKCSTCWYIVAGTRENHNYVNGECTVCYATICDYNNPNDPAHNYVNGECTVCYAVDPNHTCVESDEYGQSENGHYKKCRICNGRLGAIEAHNYEHACCTVCGEASPNHVHNYVWHEFPDEESSGYYCGICYEKKTGSSHTHNYVNKKCETCGLLDPSQTPTSIVVRNNEKKQMTLKLTFADGTSMNLTILSMTERAGDVDAVGGDIYTKEGVILSGYWLLRNDNEQYTIAYNPWGEEGSVTGNYVADASWYEIQNIAEKKGIVMDNCSYGNGVWTATGKAYDGLSATMILDDEMNVLSCMIGDGKISYKTHVQDYGWESGWQKNGTMSGTTGQSKRLEGIYIELSGLEESGSVVYRTHIQDYGWESVWKENGAMSGTTGKSKRLEAIQIKLTGELAEKYDIYYRVHAQDYGWLDWAKNGDPAGSAGYSKRLESIQIVLVAKGATAPGDTTTAYITKGLVSYQTHVQDYGWQGLSYDGANSGTTGRSKRLEGIKINLADTSTDGDICYRTHVQDYGWESGWKKNGALSGTTGQSKRLEAIQIKLTGDMAKKYDIYYRVHVQDYGWLDWATNGESAGTAGFSLRLESIQIVLVEKGATAPGSTANAFKSK